MTRRTFPSFTTVELKAAIAEGVTATRTADAIAKMVDEVAARENGERPVFVVPQIVPAK